LLFVLLDKTQGHPELCSEEKKASFVHFDALFSNFLGN
jgi:hypothetical protein